MVKLYDLNKQFEYENGFYAKADTSRFNKFITHLEFFRQTSTVRGKILESGIFKWNSFFHIDVYLYETVKEILELLYHRVTAAGIIILDDYGTFAATNKAVDDFFMNKAEIKKLPFYNTISFIIK